MFKKPEKHDPIVKKKWKEDNAEFTHRLNYNLDENSIVFDLGGYKGWFSEQINLKYKSRIFCFEPVQEYYDIIKNKFKNFDNIIVFKNSVGNICGENFIYKNKDASSFYRDGEIEKTNMVTLDSIIDKYNVKKIDLIKINIEGSEYDLLDYFIEKDLIIIMNNLQIQFHTCVENYKSRYNIISSYLGKTHYLTYKYPFIWENFRKMENI